MRKKMKNYRNIMSGLLLTAAAATAAVGMTACQSDKEEIVPQKKVWTLSMDATMGQETRALDFSDATKITPTFSTSERVAVFNVTKKTMMSRRKDGYYLAPQSDGASVKLSGTLTGDVSVGDQLKLIYFSDPGWNSFDTYDPKEVNLAYYNQVGSQSGLHEYDYALADVTVSSVTGTMIEVSGPATFQSLQSFFKAKFVFCDEIGQRIDGFTTSYPDNDYAMTISSSDNSLVHYYRIWDGTSDPVEPQYQKETVEWNQYRKGSRFSGDVYFALCFNGSTDADKLTFSVKVSGVGTYVSQPKPAPTGGFQNGLYYCPSNEIELWLDPSIP